MSRDEAPKIPDPWDRYTRPEYEQYASHQLHQLKQSRLIVFPIGGLGTLFLIFMGIDALQRGSSAIIGIWFAWVLLCFLCAIPRLQLGKSANEAVALGYMEAARRHEKILRRNEVMTAKIGIEL
jgi:hypothetical protein